MSDELIGLIKRLERLRVQAGIGIIGMAGQADPYGFGAKIDGLSKEILALMHSRDAEALAVEVKG